MNKKNNVTDKNIKIKTTGGTTVNIACSYAKDKTLEEADISAAMNRILKALEEMGIELRK